MCNTGDGKIVAPVFGNRDGESRRQHPFRRPQRATGPSGFCWLMPQRVRGGPAGSISIGCSGSEGKKNVISDREPPVFSVVHPLDVRSGSCHSLRDRPNRWLAGNAIVALGSEVNW